MAVEELEYATVAQFDDFELRQYAPHIVAETTVNGDFDQVGNVAFRRLAGYIFGKNRRQISPLESDAAGQSMPADEIAMTAPVLQEAKTQKIAMTAPVIQTERDDAWNVAFVMPAAYSSATLPEPLDTNVQLRQRPAQLVAALRYSGSWRKSTYEKKRQRLEEMVVAHGYMVTGPALFARYNPPYTLWFRRRNEVLIPVERA